MGHNIALDSSLDGMVRLRRITGPKGEARIVLSVPDKVVELSTFQATALEVGLNLVLNEIQAQLRAIKEKEYDEGMKQLEATLKEHGVELPPKKQGEL